MKVANSIDEDVQSAQGDELLTLLSKGMVAPVAAAAVSGELVALAGEGQLPLVTYSGQPGSGAVPARSVVDLHGAHIGQGVVLLFDGGDVHKPIVIGVLRNDQGWPLQERIGQVEVSANGERMIVSAQQQLVLRCGKA